MSDTEVSTAKGLYLKVQGGDAVDVADAWGLHGTGLQFTAVKGSPGLVLATGPEDKLSVLRGLLGGIKGFNGEHIHVEADQCSAFADMGNKLSTSAQFKPIFGTAIRVSGDGFLASLKAVKIA